MKGLMMKDVFTAKKILLVYFLMIVLFSFGRTQTMLFALIYALMLPVNMCSYDERSHFDRMMPGASADRASMRSLDKYVITYICAAVMMVLSVGASSARCGAWTIPENMMGSLAVMLVTHAIVMPALIRFGVAKAQAVYLGAIIIEGALILISRWNGMNMLMNIPSVEIGILFSCWLNQYSFHFVSAKMFDLRAEQ